MSLSCSRRRRRARRLCAPQRPAPSLLWGRPARNRRVDVSTRSPPFALACACAPSPPPRREAAGCLPPPPRLDDAMIPPSAFNSHVPAPSSVAPRTAFFWVQLAAPPLAATHPPMSRSRSSRTPEAQRGRRVRETHRFSAEFATVRRRSLSPARGSGGGSSPRSRRLGERAVREHGGGAERVYSPGPESRRAPERRPDPAARRTRARRGGRGPVHQVGQEQHRTFVVTRSSSQRPGSREDDMTAPGRGISPDEVGNNNGAGPRRHSWCPRTQSYDIFSLKIRNVRTNRGWSASFKNSIGSITLPDASRAPERRGGGGGAAFLKRRRFRDAACGRFASARRSAVRRSGGMTRDRGAPGRPAARRSVAAARAPADGSSERPPAGFAGSELKPLCAGWRRRTR